MSADRLSGGAAVVETLLAHDVDTVFAVPGVQLDPVFAALHDRRDRIRTIHCRHEQGAGYMAFGYAEAGGRVGTLLVVPGPGLLNAAAAIATGYACNTPMLCLSGQGRSPLIGRGRGVLHELPDQLATARTLFRDARTVHAADEIPGAVAAAIGSARAGRCRPAYLDLPLDLTQATLAWSGAPAAPPPALPLPDAGAVDALADALLAARCPLLVAGGGARDAGADIRRLAEMLDIPVAMTSHGLGTLDGRHPLAFTPAGLYHWWSQADLVVAIGTRLYPAVTAWGTDAGMSIVRVDIDPGELARLPHPAIHADAGAFARALAESLRARRPGQRPDGAARRAAVRAAVAADLAPLGPQRELLGVLRDALGEDGVLVADLTQLYYVAPDAYPVYRPRSFIHPSYQGTLGHAAAACLGVKLAAGDRPVVALTGDGGFMFTVQELATAVHFGVDVTWVVMNDGAYGNVRRMLEEEYGGRVLGADLTNPDFVRLAGSFGIEATRVRDPAGLRRALADAIAAGGPRLVEYEAPVFPSPWPLYFRPAPRGR